ncbi:sugar ABC transporter permease [Streptococcus pneumoniae]|nr:sugar ABC transporter permease [Streptococcus pneumoniae]
MAGAALAAVPIVTVFLVFQKSFTQGITMGAVKLLREVNITNCMK